MQRLWTAAELRELDRRTIDEVGVPGAALMECAGAAAAELVRTRWPDARRIAIAAGKGNNGGDGAVVARRLREAGLDAWLVLAPGAGESRGDAGTMLRAAGALGVPRHGLEGADVIVDALLGTGARGAPEGPLAALIEAVGEAGVPVLAIDVPSGVDGSSGEVAGSAVRADVTVCFHGRKLGTAIEPGRGRAGEVVTVPIGLAGSLAGPPGALLLGRDDLQRLPPRDPAGSKYDAGAVLVIGGGPSMSGAPALTARAALRAGAGVVRVLVRPSEAAVVEGHCKEAMVVVHDGGPAQAVELCAWADAVVLGPGLPRDDEARAVVDAVVEASAAPLLIDAGGLFALVGRLDALHRRTGPTALTPHAGELARLIGEQTAAVSAGRLAALERCVGAARCCVLLKGPDTLVLEPDEPLRVVETDVPALATAGAGDVLSGVSGALLARGLETAQAVALAAVAHGEAARLAARRHGTLLASDLERPLGRLLG
jgi:NAD(P)H-hydrate epimerase